MSSHTTAMQQVTKEELDMISSVADIGTDEVNESSFLRRSGRLTKSQPAPIVESLSPREGTPEAAITPKPARQIAAMKGKGMTPTDRKSPAKGKLSIAAKTAVTTGSTTQETSMDITPKSSSEVATKETTVAKSTGRTSSVNGQNPSNAVKSKAAIARQQDSAASSKAKTSPNTDDVDEEMSGAVDDAHDDDFIPDVAPLETATSGMLSLPPLGGAIPASPPSSDDALSPSKKRKSDGNNSKDGPSAKRSNTEKQPSKAKSSQDKESKPIPQGPLPHGRPLVWAEGRQALCETLDYYRAYQSGGYTLNGVGYGFLLDKDVGERSYMDEEVVIARCGGGVAKNEDGHMEQATDQSSDNARVSTWNYNMRNKVPVVLIVGSHNDHCPSQVPHRYCVMDYFQVTNVWAEKTPNGKTIFKIRFEKIHLSEKSWWAVKDSPSPQQDRDFEMKATQLHCNSCDEPSIQVFEQGWMCLNEGCKKFWFMNGVQAPQKLEYSAIFLQERTQWPKALTMPYPLKPEPLAPDTGNDAGYAVSRVCWKGVACPKCGRCNSRVHWDAWRCETGGCGFVHSVKQCVLSPRAVFGDHEIEYTGHAMLKDTYLPSVTLREHELIGNWRVNTFDLYPGNVVTHFCSNSIINKKPSGPDQLFRDLQTADIGLQRYALSSSSLAGPALTKHFTANFGMPYKYVADQETTPLAEAKPFILNALHRLTWAGEHTVKDGSFQKFNEVLTLGYFEKQAIGFHDDGEKELGPTIATLSLGCKAVMCLRMKATHYWGISKSGIYDPRAPVLPGCYKEHERRALNAKYGRISATAFEKEKKAIYGEHPRRRLATPNLLTIYLHHGDMVIMHGAEMQKYYEHSVVPENKLRFALTSRYIRPELIDPENRWKGDYTPDPAFIYNGDVPPASGVDNVAVHGTNGSSANVGDAPTPGGAATSAQ